MTQPNPSPRSSTRWNEGDASRTRSPRGRSPCVESLDCPARITSKELAPIQSVKSGILQNACSTSPRMDADEEKSAHTHIVRLMNSRLKGPKRMMTKVQWLCWKLHDNWVAYFRIWSRRSLHRFCGRAQTYWSQSDVFNSPKPCYVTPTFETKNPSLGMICPGDPHQRFPNAPKFEVRSQNETEWQERCAREAAWKLAKHILKLKEKDKTALF